jgi:DNA-binding MarR family transcriptional regulator
MAETKIVTSSSSTPLHRTDCVCTAARRAARAVTQLYDLVLFPTGLKASQVAILQAISEHGEIAQCELAREYAIAVETLSRRLAKLRAAGWLQVRISPKKKEHLYSLTHEGARVLSEAIPHWSRAQNRLAEVLRNESNLREAISALDLLTRAASEAQHLRAFNRPLEMPSLAPVPAPSLKSIGAGRANSNLPQRFANDGNQDHPTHDQHRIAKAAE